MKPQKVQVLNVSYVLTTLDSDKLEIGDILTSNNGWFQICAPTPEMQAERPEYPVKRASGFEYYTPDGVASITIGSVWTVNSVRKVENIHALSLTDLDMLERRLSDRINNCRSWLSHITTYRAHAGNIVATIPQEDIDSVQSDLVLLENNLTNVIDEIGIRLKRIFNQTEK